MRFIVDSLRLPLPRASSAAPSGGGRPDDVPRLAAVAGTDQWSRLVMNGMARVPMSPHRHVDSGQTSTRTLRWRGTGCSRSGMAGGSLVRAANEYRVARAGQEPA